MTDITPGTRRDMIETGQLRADLAAGQGQTWTTRQLTADFEVRGFSAPFAVVSAGRQPGVHPLTEGLLRLAGGRMTRQPG
jgi:hypothetical protein